MSDLGDDFKAWNKYKQGKRHERLADADTTGFTQHSDNHFSRDLCGDKLDWWPSTTKFRWRNKTHHGNVHGFINNRKLEGNE